MPTVAEDTIQTREAVVAWVAEHVPEVAESTYDHATGQREFKLPDVSVEIQTTALVNSEEGTLVGQGSGLEQALLRTFQFNVVITTNPEPEEEAADFLSSANDRLTDAILSDQTLGGRVQGCNPLIRSSFNPPFVEFEDGTLGRYMTIDLTVAMLVSLDD